MSLFFSVCLFISLYLFLHFLINIVQHKTLFSNVIEHHLKNKNKITDIYINVEILEINNNNKKKICTKKYYINKYKLINKPIEYDNTLFKLVDLK